MRLVSGIITPLSCLPPALPNGTINHAPIKIKIYSLLPISFSIYLRFSQPRYLEN